MQSRSSRKGFTLIEILIVITIIAVVASLILAGINVARKKVGISVTKTTISSLWSGLERYVQDTGKYPGREVPDFENGFPALFEALFGQKPPKGRGGPSAPYVTLKEDQVFVYDENLGDIRPAESSEIYDSSWPKYIIDYWGRPLIYHENASRARKEYMHHPKADIYSTGPDGTDQTIDGVKKDDIGSW